MKISTGFNITTICVLLLGLFFAGPACDDNGGKKDKDEVITIDPETLPSAPSGLSVGSATGYSLTLSWTDNSNNETGFYVYRSSSQYGSYSQIADTAAASYIDSELDELTSYWYRVAAYNTAGTSDQSTAASGTTTSIPAGTTIPVAPSNAAISSITESSAVFSWTDNSDDEDGFQIGTCSRLVSAIDHYACGGTITVVDEVGANVTSVTLSGLDADKGYNYCVRAYNSAGNSSNVAVHFTTLEEEQTTTSTYYPAARNIVMYNSLDSSVGNTVYSNSLPAVGINWDETALVSASGVGFASIIRFDLSEYDGKTIDSATLDLEVETAPVGYYPQNFVIQAAATAWSPSTITWNIYWDLLVYTGSVQIFSYPTYAGAVYSIDLTEIVQYWVDGYFDNNGLQIQSANYSYDPGNITTYDAYQFYQPTLTVTYH